jgi:hypothetical protein
MITNVKVTINSPELAALHGVAKGGTVSVKLKNGVPVNREWRNRFNDAKIDGCITVNQNTPKPKKKEAE